LGITANSVLGQKKKEKQVTNPPIDRFANRT